VVCAYLLATKADMTVADAVAFVKARRGIIRPNTGFMKQLDTYATRLITIREGQEPGSVETLVVDETRTGCASVEKTEVRQVVTKRTGPGRISFGIQQTLRRWRASALEKGGSSPASVHHHETLAES
jgi:hypothetical protein